MEDTSGLVFAKDDKDPATNVMYLSAYMSPYTFQNLEHFYLQFYGFFVKWAVLRNCMKLPGALYFPKTLIGSCQSFWSLVFLVARFGALWSCLVASARTAAAVLQIRASPSPGSEQRAPRAP